MPKIAIFLLAIVFLFLGSLSGVARADCNRDCNRECCKEIRITPWDRNDVCEPACKSTCEAATAICKGTGVKLPHIPSVVNLVVKGLEQSCASGFEAVTKSIIFSQGFYPAGSDYMLIEARDVLIRSQLFSAEEFNGVTIRWCSLSRGDGVTADRDYVCLSDRYFNSANHLDTAITLAHEMVHVRQYRQRETDNFKCEYSKEFIRCGGCQDNNNSLENEAYTFERNIARPRIIQIFNQAQQSVPMGNFCSTPLGRFGPGPMNPIGSICNVNSPAGLVWGRVTY